MYVKMPFGLMNVGETFQRVMNISFADEKDRFIVIYLDDISVYSKSKEDHLQHLKIVFKKCRKYGIYLNPNKSIFGMEKGKLLGHIISKGGIRIDPRKIEAIQKIDNPIYRKEVYSFIGRIKFLRPFIPNLVETLRVITNMLRKYSKIKWIFKTKKSFNELKSALTHALVLASPDYTKYFIIFFFTSKHTIVALLMQKNQEVVSSL